MNMKPKEYGAYVRSLNPKSPMGKDLLWAFCVGGLICTLGQAIRNGYEALHLEEEAAGTATSMTLIVLSIVLTGFSLYDDLAKHAGAGTLVPITGFANAMSAPAIEFRSEGYILGVGAKMFTIAGPVIVYGLAASVVYGTICWAAGLLGG